MARSSVLRNISEGKNVQPAKAWRDEKVFIYFSPRGTAKFEGHDLPGDWVVAEPRKPVSPGQEVTWQAVGGGAHKLELNLPDIFEQPLQAVDSDTVSATLRGDIEPGLYLYEAYVNGQLATGGSSPGVIVDP